MKKQPLNESFIRMQKLAGIITESYDQKATDTALQFSNTKPNTPPGATSGKDFNITTIINKIKPLVSQLAANDTTPEFAELIKDLINLIQTTNKKSLTDNEIIAALTKIISDKRKEMSKSLKEMKDMVDPNIINKAKNFIKSNHNPGEEEDHITYEYSLKKIDPEIVDYIKNKERLNVTVNGQQAAMTMKNNKVVVEFF
jgi:hypothetical protein